MSRFEHHSTARRPAAALVLLAVWGGIVALWLAVGMAAWVAALLLATTLPAAWDFATGRRAALVLDDAQIRWRSGGQEGEIALARIDHVRLETRLDLSVRVRVVLDSGKRLTLPQDALPTPQVLESELAARGVRSQRHHFALF